MKQHDFAQLRSNLLSEDLERRIPALDQACELVQEIVKIGVQMLEKGPARFLVAERLHGLGRTIIEPLQSLLIRSKESEVQILAALVLLQLGSEVGIPVLLQALDTDREYVLLIARHLAANKVDESIDKIVFRLRSAQDSEIDLIVGLLSALRTLEAKVPEDLLRRFEQSSMAWQVRTVVEEISKQGSSG